MNSFLPVEIPQNSELRFDKLPSPITTFFVLEDKIQNPSKFLFRFSHGCHVMDQRSADGRFSESSRSIEGKDFPNFGLLDARVASALNKIIQNSHFKKKVSLEVQKVQRERRFLRGRQIAHMIYDYFRVTGSHDTVVDCADLFSVTLHNDNVQDFDTRWDEIRLSVTKIPSGDVLESLHKLRLRESVQLKTVLEMYDMEIHQKISMPNYLKLKTMVKRSIDQKLQLRNFDARNEKIETGAVVTSRRGSSGIERGKGCFYRWKAQGQCSRGDQCSFRQESRDCAKPTPKAAPSSEPPKGRGASR